MFLFFCCCSNELFRLFCASIHQPKHPQNDLRLLQCQHWFLIRCLAIPLNSSLFTRLHRRIPHLHCRPTISPRFCSVCVCSSARGKQNKKTRAAAGKVVVVSEKRPLYFQVLALCYLTTPSSLSSVQNRDLSPQLASLISTFLTFISVCTPGKLLFRSLSRCPYCVSWHQDVLLAAARARQ